MQRNQFTSYLRAFALATLCWAGAGLQAQTRVLAPGRPLFTSEMADKVSGFIEWALDVRFTPTQKQEYKEMLANDWADSKKRKSALEVLEIVDKVAAAPPDTRNGVQGAVRRALLDDLRKEGGAPRHAGCYLFMSPPILQTLRRNP